MQLQPNFEIFKKCIFNAVFTNQSTTGLSQQMTLSVLGGEFKAVYKKVDDLKKEVNAFLDTLDIRQVPFMIANNKEVNYPKWLRNGNYVIDYNDEGFLDLIKTI